MSETYAIALFVLTATAFSYGLWLGRKDRREAWERASEMSAKYFWQRQRSELLIATLDPTSWCAVCVHCPVTCPPGSIKDCRGPELEEATDD